jgi:hypothetical protein
MPRSRGPWAHVLLRVLASSFHLRRLGDSQAISEKSHLNGYENLPKFSGENNPTLENIGMLTKVDPCLPLPDPASVCRRRPIRRKIGKHLVLFRRETDLKSRPGEELLPFRFRHSAKPLEGGAHDAAAIVR